MPLNEAQARRLAVTLGDLERDLRELREAVLRPPRDLRMTRYEGGFDLSEAAVVLPAIDGAEEQLRRIADDLGLEASSEPVRRGFMARLALANVGLYEVRPMGGLRGYGEVAAETAEYLEREIAKLEAAVREVMGAIQQGSEEVGA